MYANKAVRTIMEIDSVVDVEFDGINFTKLTLMAEIQLDMMIKSLELLMIRGILIRLGKVIVFLWEAGRNRIYKGNALGTPRRYTNN